MSPASRILIVTLCLASCMAGCRNHRATTKPADQQDFQKSRTVRGAIHFAPAMDGLPYAGMWKCDPALADVNQDGRLDLAAVPRLNVKDLGNGPRFWLSNADGSWSQSSEGLDTGEISCGGGLEFIDINGDDLLDLVVADHCQGVFVYLGDGQGNWRMVTRQLYPETIVPDPEYARMYMGAENLAVGDLNNDGYADIVSGASDRGGMHLYLGDGSGANWERTPSGLPESDWVPRVLVADMDGDGDLDVVASHSDGPRVWHNDGTGQFTAAFDGLPSPIMRGIFIGLSIADFNLDGRPDIAVANWVDGPAVYLQQEDHTWQKTANDVFPDMMGGAVGVAAGDLNNDQIPDLAVAGRLTTEGGFSRGVFVLLGDGNGGFTYVLDSGLPEVGLGGPGGIAVADIDGDGWLDIAHGNGLLTESGKETADPNLPQHLLVWRNLGLGSN